jgi:hypothetical protein
VVVADLDERRTYYADKYDLEDLGTVAEADGRPGWKCYSVLDGGYLRTGTGVCRPLLGGLCTDAQYRTATDQARCAGVPAEKHLSPFSHRYEQPVRSDRFRPPSTAQAPHRSALGVAHGRR